MEIKHIEVVEYNKKWPEQFAKEAEIIKKSLKSNFVAIYHIGSTAIIGLSAKPKIDIIAVVRNGKDSILELESIGYSYRGEWNIPFKYGFTKKNFLLLLICMYMK